MTTRPVPLPFPWRTGLAGWPAARELGWALAVLAPFAVFAAHAACFGTWLIDDAGISFAYARNLVLGHGLVSQPGAAAVEGFSNPAWTLLLALCQRLGAVDLVVIAKWLALVLTAATFVLMVRDAVEHGHAPAWGALAPTLLALSTSFTVWAVSGLENPLLALLTAASATLAIRALEGRDTSHVGAGVVGALLALTRPEAILLAAAHPLALAVARPAEGRGLRWPLGHALGFVPVYGGYLLFRRRWFGDWVPNTYHAKEKPALASLLDLDRWSDLLAGTGGRLGALAACLTLLLAARLAWKGRLSPRLQVLLTYLGVAATTYLLMPIDWMGEYRFATAFLVLFAWTFAAVLGDSWSTAPRGWTRGMLVLLVLAVLAESARVHVERTRAFASRLVTPLASIQNFAGRGYNQVADALGAPQPSLLIPDLGGALLDSRLRVIDLVGLCDRTTALTLTQDTPAFHRYVFEDVRPTFIHVHGAWAGWAALHAWPRFSLEYAPIHEVARAPGEDAERAYEHGAEPWRGDYVRRDALGRDPDAALERVRAAFLAAGMNRATF